MDHNSQFMTNVLGVFELPTAAAFQYFKTDVWVPLNFLPDELEFRIVDARNQRIPLNGYLFVELKGQLKDPIYV